jgi:ubiquinone/menaquinone biosynthesis C-methylase UbiE
MSMKRSSTSWEKVGKWYDESVGEQGHYYHQSLIIPHVLKLLDFKDPASCSLLDLACGQGVLGRQIPNETTYVGIDSAISLIKAARHYNKNPLHQYLQSDVTQKLPITKTDFTHASIILALQNIEHPQQVLKNVSSHLQVGGKLIIILNHPCFRIPRQSSWKVDAENKIQYRRIDRYMSSMTIPIQMHPGKGGSSPQTVSFHHPLSAYSSWLKEAGFTIDLIDEWCSNKVSEGKAAKMENRSRAEIPLFMAILASKKS